MKKKDKFAAVDAALDFKIFKTSKLTKGQQEKSSEIRHRIFGKGEKEEEITIENRNGEWLTMLDQTIFLTLLRLSAIKRVSEPKKKRDNVITIAINLNSLRKEAGVKSQTNKVKESLERLQNIIYSGNKDPEAPSPLIICSGNKYLKTSDGKNTDILDGYEQDITIHPRLTRAIDSLIKNNGKSGVKYSYFTVDLNERENLSSIMPKSEQAILIHAWLSSITKVGGKAKDFYIKRLLGNISVINENILNDSIRAKYRRCMDALDKLSSVGWIIHTIDINSLIKVRRSGKKKNKYENFNPAD